MMVFISNKHKNTKISLSPYDRICRWEEDLIYFSTEKEKLMSECAIKM